MENTTILWAILPLYTVMYIIIGTFFNLKIISLAKERYFNAAILSFFTEFLFAFSIIFTSIFASDAFAETGQKIGYIITSTTMMAMGSFISVYLSIYIENKTQEKKESTIQDTTTSNNKVETNKKVGVLETSNLSEEKQLAQLKSKLNDIKKELKEVKVKK